MGTQMLGKKKRHLLAKLAGGGKCWGSFGGGGGCGGGEKKKGGVGVGVGGGGVGVVGGEG